MIPSWPQHAPVTYPAQHAVPQQYQSAPHSQPAPVGPYGKPIHFATTVHYARPGVPAEAPYDPLAPSQLLPSQFQQPYQMPQPQPAPQPYHDQVPYGQGQQLLVPFTQTSDHYLPPSVPQQVVVETQAPQRSIYPPRYDQMLNDAYVDGAPLSREMEEAMREALAGQDDYQGDFDAQAANGNNGQFLDLLESLEARVELMSQMQHTRVAIQKRAHAIASMHNGEDVDYAQDYGQDYGPEDDYGAQQEMQYDYAVQDGQAGFDNDGNELMTQFLDQRECINRLTNEVETMRRQMASLQQGDGGGARNAALTALETQAVPSLAMPNLGEAVKPGIPGTMAPFCRLSCGANLALSEDGYTAKRERACRSAVCMGSAPISRQTNGYFFETTVVSTVEGWVGGLGIGVTRTKPGTLRRVPDKAWRVPNSFVVGYWGCIFLDGNEHRCTWRADSLEAGARVGLLVTDDGRNDMIIFVNGVPVARVDGALSSGGGANADPLYAIIDVFSSTREVSLSRQAAPPPRPWRLEATELSPPLSLGGAPAAG